MKIALFTGTAYRHNYFANTLIGTGNVVLHIREERSNLITDEVSATAYSESDARLLQEHSDLRLAKEKEYFLPLGADVLKSPVTLEVTKEELNGDRVVEAVKAAKPDIVFVYGTHLHKKNLLAVLPEWTINLHAGLSPFYKGGATLYWPIYFMEPQGVGYTFHLINERIDNGAILHQNRPEIFAGDTIHDLGCRTIVVAGNDALKLIQKIGKNEIIPQEQKSNGKIFYDADFKPYHLRVTQFLMKNGLFAEYLENKNLFPDPKMVQQL